MVDANERMVDGGGKMVDGGERRVDGGRKDWWMVVEDGGWGGGE